MARHHANRGNAAEDFARAVFDGYNRQGIALCIRQHPAVRVTRTFQNWKIEGFFEKQGAPDWLIITKTCTIMLDVKSSATGRWPFNDLPEHQAEKFDQHSLLGQPAGILLTMRNEWWWIPWRTLRAPWVRWFTEKERAQPGTASLTTSECSVLGTRLGNPDFLRVVDRGAQVGYKDGA